METVLKALAEPRRVEVLKLIKGRRLTVGQIASHFEVSRPAVSQHLRVLLDAELVTRQREGTKQYYAIRPETFAELYRFLDQFWDERLAELKHVVENDLRDREDGATGE